MKGNIDIIAFVKENLALARTIVIKNESLAIADNTLMKQHYGIDSGSDRSQWRYYLNLFGEYHKTDQIMTVRSLDDNELIPFTKATLEQHPATKKAYRLGGYYFSRLNAAYPGQSDLIQGIINPISQEEALAAKDFQILRYTKEYVNWNETQLIPALQDDIDKNVYQFYNTEYTATDNLMTPSLIALLENCIFQFLLQNRFENKKTRHAHPFFIWSHLQSLGISPIYKDLLNEKQTMWLFRNIEYVLRNLGKEKTFKELIEILLTERNIPLLKYDLVQSTEEMKETLQPEPLYYSERLNLIDKKGLGGKLNNVSKIMTKEMSESLDNEINYPLFYPKTKAEAAFGVQSEYPIKVLDSDLVDITNRKPETIYQVLNNELIYLSGKNLYNINIDIEEPLTGSHIRLSIKEAIVLWHHLLNQYNGIDCKTIHPFYYQKVLKITPPTLSTLLSTGTKPFITEEWCRDVLKTVIPQIRMVSPSIFYQNSVDIFNLKWTHEKMYTKWPSIGYYSRRKNAISSLYETGFVRLTSIKTYAEFLSQWDIDFTDYTQATYFRLMWEIWKKMTGWDQFKHITVAQIQSGMMGLMKFLSSYHVQYIYQTVLEQGWYEGGIDLFTENPMLLNRDSEGQIELEESTDRWIPVHHRNTTDEEEEYHYGEEGRFEKGSVTEELSQYEKIQHDLRLYDYDINDLNDNVHGGYFVDLSFKCREYTPASANDSDQLTPMTSRSTAVHSLHEMTVDVFEGVRKIGDWEAKNIAIVNNGFDNQGVADTVNGFAYEKINKTETWTKNGVSMNRYYVGYVPALFGNDTVKLDIIAEHAVTGKTRHVRFDYPVINRPSTGSVVYDVPKTLALNTPFTITPTIKGVPSANETIVSQTYIVKDTDREYLHIQSNNGTLTGTLLKQDSPDTLSVMCVIQTKNDNSNELLSRHYYYLTGEINATVTYNPLTDPLFEPVFEHNIADTHAMTLERVTVGNSQGDWEVVSLGIKTDSQGNLPANTVKTDYNGIANFLTPPLEEKRYTDSTLNGKAVRTFEWLYAIYDEGVTIPLVLTLQNKKGERALKEVNYTPTVIDHGAGGDWGLHPYDLPINLYDSFPVTLRISGLSKKVTITAGLSPQRSPYGEQDINMTYDGKGEVVEDNDFPDDTFFSGYEITMNDFPIGDDSWGVKVKAETKTAAGKTLTLYPYGTVTLTKDDYEDHWITGNTSYYGYLYTESYAGVRLTVSGLRDYWEVEHITLGKENNPNLDLFTDKLYDGSGNVAFDNLPVVFLYGKDQDGDFTYPTPNTYWMTFKGLIDKTKVPALSSEEGGRFLLNVTLTIKNTETGKYRDLLTPCDIQYRSTPFTLVNKRKIPAVLQPGKTNAVRAEFTPVFNDRYGQSSLVSSEGVYFGMEDYRSGNEKPTCEWNGKNQFNLTLPTPPLTSGDGITLFAKNTYRLLDAPYAGTSVEEYIEFPSVYYRSSEIALTATLSAEDLSFTQQDDASLSRSVAKRHFKGVRSSTLVLFDEPHIKTLGWKIKDVTFTGDIVTAIDGVDLQEWMQVCERYDSALLSLSEKEKDYAVYHLAFVPASVGELTLTVNVALEPINGIGESTVMSYPLTVLVYPTNGAIAFHTDYPDPWWLIGKDTFVKTQLIGDLDVYKDGGIDAVIVPDASKEKIQARIGVNGMLSPDKVLAVTPYYAYVGDAPQVIVIHQAHNAQYEKHDPRYRALYFTALSINPDRLYRLNDITLSALDFQQDIGWNTQRQYQSYTERYAYRREIKGWEVNRITLQEAPEWMNHVIEYNGVTEKHKQLFHSGRVNQVNDGVETSGDDRYYYLPTYGSRVIGQQPIAIHIELLSRHHAMAEFITLTYTKTINVIEGAAALMVDPNGLTVGDTTALKTEMVNVPYDDAHAGLTQQSTEVYVLSNDLDNVKVEKDPLRITLTEAYQDDQGIMLSESVVYDTVNTTLTEQRGYRADRVINRDDVTNL